MEQGSAVEDEEGGPKEYDIASRLDMQRRFTYWALTI